MSTGSIAGIAAAGACFLIAILAIFFCVRKKNRRARRAQADNKFRPTSLYTSYGAAMEHDGVSGGAGGMVERKSSFQSYNGRQQGGPRPPTMIESGRAGMGAGRAVSPVPSMPNPNSYYASPSGPGSIPLPSTPTYPAHNAAALPSPQVFAIGSVLPAPQLNQPPAARSFSPHDQQQFYSRAPSPPSAPAAHSYGYGAPEPQMYQQQPQQYYPQQPQQQPQYDYGGAPMMGDPYGGAPGGFATGPGAYSQASPIDRLPPPPAFIPQQQGHQQIQHQQQQPQRVQQQQPDLDDAYGGM